MSEPTVLPQTQVTIKVPFHDVDSMKIVWHGNYAKYFAAARCALLDSIGYNYNQMEASGFAWPVIDMRIKYIKPAHFNQDITVSARLTEYENRLKIEYLVQDAATGAKLTRGYTVQVAVEMPSGVMKFYSPPILLERLGISP